MPTSNTTNNNISTPARYPNKLSASHSYNRPTPLHRRGTSSKYESLEELLREHGYSEVRVVTPLAERLASAKKEEMRKASGLSNGSWSKNEQEKRERKNAAAAATTGAPTRMGYGKSQQKEGATATDLLRGFMSGWMTPTRPSHVSTTTPQPQHPRTPDSPTPLRARPPPFSFLSTDPYRTPTPRGKLHHARSQPHLARRPLTPVTNHRDPRRTPSRPGSQSRNSNSHTGRAVPPLLTPTRVQCRSRSRERSSRSPGAGSPPLLVPSPPPSPSNAVSLAKSSVRPSTTLLKAPAPPGRDRSIRSLRAHLEPYPRAESPDFSDPSTLGGHQGDGEGENPDEADMLWQWGRKGTPKRVGLPWSWGTSGPH